MAHGSPRLEMCIPCLRYTLVSRFTTNTVCDKCKKKLTPTTKAELIEKYNASLFWFVTPNFGHFISLK